MIKKLSKLMIFVLLVLPFTLSAQKYQDGLVDKVVALIGNEAIFLSQIEGEVQMMQAQGFKADRNTRCKILEDMLEKKLFLNQAKVDSLTVNEEMVNMELKKRIASVMTQLGGEKETEAYFKKPVHKIKDEWREILREQSLMQQMQQSIMGDAGEATPSEVEKFYKDIDKENLRNISTQYKLSQIVLYPDQESAKLATKERLLSFRDRILKGERFSTLASLYSDDLGSAIRGGELRMASKTLYWPAFSDAAMALKPGQISQIVETPDGFHIIQMIEKDGEMFNARHILLKPNYTLDDRQKAFEKLDSIRSKILADSLKFDYAAKRFSMDIKSAINGGSMFSNDYMTPDGGFIPGSVLFEKDQLKPMDYSVIKDMKEGDISEPFESTDDEGRTGNTIYKIIKIDKIVPPHVANIKENFTEIKTLANNSRQEEAISKFIEEKQKETFIRIDDLFKQCNFKREGWIK